MLIQLLTLIKCKSSEMNIFFIIQLEFNGTQFLPSIVHPALYIHKIYFIQNPSKTLSNSYVTKFNHYRSQYIFSNLFSSRSKVWYLDRLNFIVHYTLLLILDISGCSRLKGYQKI